MATLYITEFSKAVADESGASLQAMKLPPLAHATVAIGGASAQSAAFVAGTKIIRVACDAACHISYGVNPVATTSSAYLPANAVEYFGVEAGGKLAVIAGA